MFEKRRLHPAAILFNMVKPFKEFFLYFLIILIAGDVFIFFIFLGIFLLLDFIYAFLSWYRYSYYVTDEALWLEYGLFKRTKRSIAKNRIQSIDLTENLIHRILKLTSVKIETASGGAKAEAVLKAVTLEDGRSLSRILKSKGDMEETHIAEEKPLAERTITFRRLLLAGVTSGGVGIIIGFLIAGIVEIEEIIPEHIFDVTYKWFLTASLYLLVLLVLLILLAVYLASVLWMILRYGNFTIKRTDNELIITRGILERKQITIPFQRIQAIGIEENMIRQPFGYASVFVEVAGGKTEGDFADSTILFPLLHKEEIPGFLDEFVPDFTWQEDEINWIKPPPSAIRFYLIRSSTFFLLATIPVMIFFPSFVWIPIVLFFLSLGIGFLRYKDAGFYAGEKRILIRYRLLTRTTVQLYHKRIQSFEKEQHAMQRKYHLASMMVSIISNSGGRHFHVKDIDEEQIDLFSDKISYRKTDQSGINPD